MNISRRRLTSQLWPTLGIIVSIAGGTAIRADGQVGTTTPQATIITSERAELQNTGVDAYTVFEENVRLTGTNLEVTCDKLEVFGEQIDDPERESGTLGKIRPRRILATGNVIILQAGRKATAETLEILPQEDKIVLSGNPVVTDIQGTAAGDRITFFRGDQHFIVERPRIEMRSLPNLGFPQDPGSPPKPESSEDVSEPAPTPADE